LAIDLVRKNPWQEISLGQARKVREFVRGLALELKKYPVYNLCILEKDGGSAP